MIRDFTMYLRSAGKFRLRGSVTGEFTKRLVIRPTKRFRSESLSAIQHPLQMRHAARTMIRIRTQRIVVLIRNDGHRRRPESMILQRLANLLEVPQITGIKDRHLDAVVTDGFQFLEDRKLTFDEMRRPQQEIEPNFHKAPE